MDIVRGLSPVSLYSPKNPIRTGFLRETRLVSVVTRLEKEASKKCVVKTGIYNDSGKQTAQIHFSGL